MATRQRKEHRKLVRDLVPASLEQRGIACFVVTLGEDTFRKALIQKLREEAEEFVSNPCEEELADVLEVVEALRQFFPLVDDARRVKRDLRGGFAKRLFLVSTEESGTS